MLQKKNQYVDLLKAIACIIVIFLHCPLPGFIGEGIIYGLRFSVPVFFMVSGYYSQAKSHDWIWTKAKYILKLLLFTELFYGVWFLVKNCIIEQTSIQGTIASAFANKNVLEVIFCGTLFNGTLWYLYAMFWTWIMVYVLRKKGILNKCYILIPILLAVQILGRAYVQNTHDIDKWVFLFRNALTFGLPFTLLGAWIAEKKEVLIDKISMKKNLLIIAVGFFLIVVEFLIFGQYMDTHVSTVLISTGLFLYAIRKQGAVPRFLQWVIPIGAKWYTWIYLSHIFIAELLGIILVTVHMEENRLVQFSKPIMVCVLACLCSECIIRFIKVHPAKPDRFGKI